MSEQDPKLNSEVEEIYLKVNELADSIREHNLELNMLNDLRGTFASGISGGYDGADTLHNIYYDYGYPAQLGFGNFWNMYRRFGIATAIIEKPVDTCFLTDPEIEASDKIVNEIELLDKQVKLWDRVKGADKRQRVGRYAGLFMQVRDNKNPSEPLEGKLSGVNSLARIIPIYEGQLSVETTEQSIMSENYGNPTLYQYQPGNVGNRNEKNQNSFAIHPSRLIIFSEGADDGSIYGIPALEAPYNSLLDCRKIIGGGGEGFYRNAAQNLVFKTNQGARTFNSQTQLDEFNKEAEEFTRKRMRKNLYAPNMDVVSVDSSLMSPKEFFMTALNDVAASCGIPATILIGQQTGRLASDEDSRHFLAMMQSRRENYLTEAISNVINWLMEYGIVASGEYEITWDDLLATSDDEKLSNADKMAGVNQKQFSSGQPAVFAVEEIREAAGMEDITDQDLEDDMVDDEDMDDDDSAEAV